MFQLRIVVHRPGEVKVGHEEEVDHRHRDRAPGMIGGDRHLPFSIGLEGSAQPFDEYQAGTACLARLDEDGVQETARGVLLARLLREFNAGEASKRSSVGVIWPRLAQLSTHTRPRM